MSAIEGRAKDVLLPMILGQRVELSPERQLHVATWIFKTCLIYQAGFLDIGNETIPAEHYAHLYAVRKHPRPPGRTQIWLGAYAGARHSRGDYHSADLSAPEGSEHPAGLKAYSATLVVGYLEMQIYATFGYDQNAADVAVGDLGGFNHAQIPIWPANAFNVIWPPPDWVDDGGLDVLVGSFMGERPLW
jgi:hypothetical protein